MAIGEDSNDDDRIDKILETKPHRQVHRGGAVEFTLPPHRAVVVEVRQTKPGAGMPRQVVDLALAPQDIDCRDGKLFVTAHNIGNKDSGKFAVRVWEGEASTGKLVRTFTIERLEAPNDLEPRTAVRSFAWSPPAGATPENPVKITVELDPEDRYYEITEENNVKSRSFPYTLKAHETPRLWLGLAAKYGLRKGDPFPPNETVR